jgi:ornithine carbamoyltransferase
MTIEEQKGKIDGVTVAWIGDTSNTAVSWIHAAAHFKFKLRMGCPKPYMPKKEIVAAARKNGADIEVMEDPQLAIKNADVVLTDTWVSMGFEQEAINRRELLTPYQVNEKLMSYAKKDSIFMHCLPAYRGQEVTREVIDGPQSVVWDEAENRLHVQKAVMAWCMGKLADIK